MTSDLRDRLRSEILAGPWTDLKPHAERNALFVVAQELDLAEVGIKTVADDAAAVSQWIQSGQIARPTADQVRAWDQQESKSFQFLIVQPYVLIQEQSH